jgi:hypothetical protein
MRLGLAIVLLALTITLTVRTCVASTETFTTEEANMLAEAILSAQTKLKRSWTPMHADVFEAYVKVNGMPPTDLVLEHYLFLRQTNDLGRSALEERMQKDLPSDKEE